ncbi:MAG: hypothetical protein Tsb0018_06800 [Opitutales bacterium]
MNISTALQETPEIDTRTKPSKKDVLMKGDLRYSIASVQACHRNPDAIELRIQVKGTRATFSKRLDEVYTEKWLPHFSPQDVTRMGNLISAQKETNKTRVHNLTRAQSAATHSVVILGMAFVAVLLIANVLAFKLTWINLGILPLGSLTFNLSFQSDCGFFIFPLTFFINDVLTEVYGFRTTRLVIWGGLGALLVATISIEIALHLPASPFWQHQEAYATVLGASWRIFAASCIAYLCGEFLNSMLLARLKVLTQGKHLWFRATTSTFLGSLVDTTLLFYLGFLGSLPHQEAFRFIALGMAIKMTCEIVLLPCTYWLSSYLKKKDGVDTYESISWKRAFI